MKRILLLISALMLYVAVSWSEEVEIDRIVYSLNDISKTASVITQTFESNFESITEIIIPETIEYNSEVYTVTSIDSEAFFNCPILANVVIPQSVTYIGESAFMWFSGLLSVNIPYGITEIGFETFYGCNNLKSITIPSSVRRIAVYAFEGCSSLTSISIPSSVEDVEEAAFKGCTNLTSVEWNVKGTRYYSENNSPFDNDGAITTFTFGNEVEEILSGLCSDMTSLKEVNIGSGVTIIGETAFNGCINLEKISVSQENQEYSSIDGVLFNKDKTKLIMCPKGRKGSYTIPTSVTTIGVRAFAYCTGLESVNILSGVTSIGSGAFDGCSELKSITIPNSVTSIGNNAFEFCSELTSITIPSSVTSIGISAFKDCSNLTSVEWNIIRNNEVFYSVKDSPLFASGITTITFGDEVEDIPAYLCSGITTLKEVNIGSRVTTIGERAFRNCAALTGFIVDEDNDNYSSEEGVLFNKNKTELICYPIGKQQTDYVVPNSVTLIKESAFEDCVGLNSVTIGNNVKTIGDAVFENCRNLKSIIIPNSVTELGEGTFWNCSSLTSVTIGDGVTDIIEEQFGLCEELTSVTIGKNVTFIDEYAFDSSEKLTKIVLYSNVVPTVYENSFINYNATLYVPCDLYDAYSNHEVFGKFKVIECINEDKPTDVVETLADANITISDGLITCQDAEFAIYNTLGQDVTAYNGSLQPGVYVVSVADDFIKVMVK